MPNTARIRIGFLHPRATPRHRWKGWLRRNVSALPVLFKWTIALGVSALISCIDLIAAVEVRFSIFYIVPIAYATWFIQPRSGVLLAILCEVIWLAAEMVYGGESADAGILLRFASSGGVPTPIPGVDLKGSKPNANGLATLDTPWAASPRMGCVRFLGRTLDHDIKRTPD